jgi:pimeloyl-ACP methyl ester carboxylesterase
MFASCSQPKGRLVRQRLFRSIESPRLVRAVASQPAKTCEARLKRSLGTCPCLILPGLGNATSDYIELKSLLPAHSLILPIARYDWLRNARGLLLPAYWRGALEPRQVMNWYFFRLEQALIDLRRNLGEEEDWGVNLIGHSAGGWLARLFVSEFAREDLRRRIRVVVTLGTPNVAPPAGVFDQTRGILSYLESRYSWQHRRYSGVRYVCVGSKAVRGRPWSLNVAEMIAYASYWPVCGRGSVVGDGIVPACSSFMRGAQAILLPDAKHSPLTDRSNWYGSPHQFVYWSHTLA